MIQISLVGKTPIVVEDALKKFIPNKLYILHTLNQEDYPYKTKAQELKKKIETEYCIPY